MTRINVLEPSLLLDQHLMAEIKEINQLSGQFLTSLKSRNGVDRKKIPKSYTLNTGHVYFFYDKGKFLKNRFNILVNEAIKRKYNITCKFYDIWSQEKVHSFYLKDWISDKKDLEINKKRIFEKVQSKKNFYRYYGEKISYEDYINMFKKESK